MTIYIQFRLGVQEEGSFRFFVNVEAETDDPVPEITQRRQLKTRRSKASKVSPR